MAAALGLCPPDKEEQKSLTESLTGRPRPTSRLPFLSTFLLLTALLWASVCMGGGLLSHPKVSSPCCQCVGAAPGLQAGAG